MDGYRLSAIGLSAMFKELPRNAGDDDTVTFALTARLGHSYAVPPRNAGDDDVAPSESLRH